MDAIRLQWCDMLIVAAYLIICLVIGLHRSTKVTTPRQFALGYKNISTTILVCVIFASTISGGTLLGYAERLTLFGLAFGVAKLFAPIGWLVTARVYSPNIMQFSDCISISQIMFKLYGPLGRWVTNISSIVMCIGVLVAQALAIGFVFHYFFGVEIIYGILISYGILTLYTVLGGVRAVVITELFQFSIFFFIIPASYVIILQDIGGIPNLMSESLVSDLGFEFITTEDILILTSLILFTIMPECNAPFIQRCLMATSAQQLKQTLKSVSLISLPFILSLWLMALIVKTHSPEVPDNEAFVFYISNYLPAGLKGLMVAGIIAAIMGLAEAWLNATSVIIVNDILKAMYPTISNTKQLLSLRIFVICLSATSVGIAFISSNAVKVIWLVHCFCTPLILIPLAAGFLGLRTSPFAFVGGVIIALIFTMVSGIMAGEFSIVSLCLGIIGNALGFFGMHYLQFLKKPGTVLKYGLISKPALTRVRIVSIFDNIISCSFKQIKHMASPKQAPYQRFAVFTLVYYFLYTLSLTSNPTHKIFSYLLVIGYLMCFILLLRDVAFSARLKQKYLPIYWYCTLTFCLPLVASYMLFASTGDDFWIINGLLSAFSLYFFTDAVTFIILLTTGVICGYGLFSFNDPAHKILEAHNTLQHIGYIYLSFIFAYLVLFRGKEKEQEERIGQMHLFSGAVAHEVKSPITSIIMCSEAVTDILSRTVGTAQNDNAGKYTITLAKDEYDLLMQSNKSIYKASARGLNTVNSILTSLKSSVVGDEKQLHLIEKCVKQAIYDYSLFNSSTKNIEMNIKHNFKIMCSLHYITNVILNLLKNAHKHGGENVKIRIWTQGSCLYFKDYGIGVPKENLPYIFDRFYTGNKTGTGIGLAFCKMVMEDLGGYIECKSKLGKYTKFTLFFPRSK